MAKYHDCVSVASVSRHTSSSSGGPGCNGNDSARSTEIWSMLSRNRNNTNAESNLGLHKMPSNASLTSDDDNDTTRSIEMTSCCLSADHQSSNGH